MELELSPDAFLTSTTLLCACPEELAEACFAKLVEEINPYIVSDLLSSSRWVES